MKKQILTTLFLGILSVVSFAQTKFASPFSNNMVLQRNSSVKIWGVEAPNTELSLTTSWDNQTHTTSSDSEGKWNLFVNTPEGSEDQYKLTLDGSGTITLSNVLVGEVWICSGQSNMEMDLTATVNGAAVAANATDTNMRYMSIGRQTSLEEQDEFSASWQILTTQKAKWFSAVGYYFGKMLRDSLKVPIGLIDNSYGASFIEAWIDKETIEAYDFANIPDVLSPDKPYKDATAVYNASVHPLLGYGIKGVIWYQGESNAEMVDKYSQMLPAMINSWRQKWGVGDFSFYYVQVVPYVYKQEHYPFFWNMLKDVHYRVENTGVVVTLDNKSCDQIHPAKKKYVGDRLALWALSNDYEYEDIVCSGPLCTKAQRIDNTLKVYFDYAETGLIAGPNGLSGFELAGSDRVYHTADVLINYDNTLILSSNSVPEPKFARYGFGDCSEIDASLFNGVGLPASAFLVMDTLNTGAVESNVALNKPVTFSAFQDPNDKLTDGIASDASRWSVAGYPNWAEVDLGADYEISQFLVYPYSGRAYQYFIEVKTNESSSWETVVDRKSNTDEGEVFIDAAVTTARYVKITITGASAYTGGWASISELKIIGEIVNTDSTANVTDVSINPMSAYVDLSKTIQLEANVTPGNTGASVIWSSSDTSVATVDDKGFVSAIGFGTANITASAADGKFRATCFVTVPIHVNDISVYPTSLSMAPTDTAQLKAIYSPDDATIKSALWESNNTTVATVDIYGKIIALANGYATIKATAEDGSFVASCELEVTPTPNVALHKPIIFSTHQTPHDNLVDGNTNDSSRWMANEFPQWAEIDLGTDYDISQFELFPYQNRDYQYTIDVKAEQDAGYTTAIDRSSNTTGGGVISDTLSVSCRYVRLTVSGANSYDGSSVDINEFKVRGALPKVHVTGLSIDQPNAIIKPNKTIQLAAIVAPDNATDNSVVWLSDNPAIATVDANGLLTGVTEGLTNIKASSIDGNYTATCKVLVSSAANVAEKKSVTASGVTDPVSNLVDENTGSRWSSNPIPQWAEIDLGADYEIIGFEVFPYQKRDYRYTIKVKTDKGSDYTTAVNRGSNDIQADKLTDIVSTTGRYVRINVNGANTYSGSFASLNELKVYGDLVQSNAVAYNNLEGIKVFPNPTLGVLNIVFDTAYKNPVANVVDSTGRILITEQLNKIHNKLDLSSMRPSFYLLYIRDANQVIWVSKINLRN